MLIQVIITQRVNSCAVNETLHHKETRLKMISGPLLIASKVAGSRLLLNTVFNVAKWDFLLWSEMLSWKDIQIID